MGSYKSANAASKTKSAKAASNGATATSNNANAVSTTAAGTTTNLSSKAQTGEQSTKSEKPFSPPQVLDPNNYVGLVKAGYAAAKEIPDICDKLFCYCGCDLTDCHGSLLDCFTSDHGVDCRICQEEAILALKFHKQGKTLAQIQKIIDKRYEKEYPFEVESEALQRYKASRLWQGGKKAKASQSGKLGSIAPQNSEGVPLSNAGKRRLRKDGSCCEGDKEK